MFIYWVESIHLRSKNSSSTVGFEVIFMVSCSFERTRTSKKNVTHTQPRSGPIGGNGWHSLPPIPPTTTCTTATAITREERCCLFLLCGACDGFRHENPQKKQTEAAAVNLSRKREKRRESKMNNDFIVNAKKK
jgi:hypothetical protein